MEIYRTIISPNDLQPHLNDLNWVIVDCRFDLKNPAWSETAYLDGHIPGAVYADLERDLSIPKTPQTGRHPLPPVTQIVDRLQNWGIANHSQVVVYDHQGGALAARLWWMLRYLGHKAVAVLDGGLPAWQAANLPLERGRVSRTPEVFQPVPDAKMLMGTNDLVNIYTDPGYLLIDARAPERYRGETEPIDPIAGHIPGAINRFHGENLAPDGSFLPKETLRQQFSQLLGNTPPERSIVYCGSGVTSCLHLVALEHAGLAGGLLYLGSWSEWITDPNRPIA